MTLTISKERASLLAEYLLQYNDRKLLKHSKWSVEIGSDDHTICELKFEVEKNIDHVFVKARRYDTPKTKATHIINIGWLVNFVIEPEYIWIGVIRIGGDGKREYKQLTMNREVTE